MRRYLTVPYRNMCRFNSGVGRFQRTPWPSPDHSLSSSGGMSFSRSTTTTGASSKLHPATRFPLNANRFVLTRPSVKFYCDMLHDPFLFMQDNKKVYGFTISLPEYGETIETLWDTTKGWDLFPYPGTKLTLSLSIHEREPASDA